MLKPSYQLLLLKNQKQQTLDNNGETSQIRAAEPGGNTQRRNM